MRASTLWCWLTMLIALMPSAAAGQVCGALISCGGPPDHNFIENEPRDRAEMPAEGGGYHGECLVCYDWFNQPISAYWCHVPCPGGQQDAQLAFESLLETARTGNVEQVVTAASAIPERVLVNEGRRSLQLLDCRGEIIANLPLGPAFHRALDLLPGRVAAVSASAIEGGRAAASGS